MKKDIQQSLQLRGIGEAADTMVFYGYNSALIFDMGLSSAVLSFITLVRTIPGLWSRMCSRVAAISISFTPELKTKQQTTIFSMPYFPKHYFFTSFTSFHHVLTFSHAVQNHVDQDVCSSQACTITAQKGDNVRNTLW